MRTQTQPMRPNGRTAANAGVPPRGHFRRPGPSYKGSHISHRGNRPPARPTWDTWEAREYRPVRRRYSWSRAFTDVATLVTLGLTSAMAGALFASAPWSR